MKRLLSLIVLSVFLFNVMGYYCALELMKGLAGDRMSDRLATEMYEVGGHITIKVPFALPSETTTGDYFEKEGGTFEMDGIVYQVIKTRYYDNMLYIVCLKNDASSKVNTALKGHAKSFGTNSESSGRQLSSPDFFKDYIDTFISLTSSTNGWEQDIFQASQSVFLSDSHSPSISHPPSLG